MDDVVEDLVSPGADEELVWPDAVAMCRRRYQAVIVRWRVLRHRAIDRAGRQQALGELGWRRRRVQVESGDLVERDPVARGDGLVRRLPAVAGRSRRQREGHGRDRARAQWPAAGSAVVRWASMTLSARCAGTSS